MSIQILQEIADKIPEMDKNIEDMKVLIEVAEEQGVQAIELKTNMNKLKQQRDKMYKSLKARGYIK